MFDPAVSVVVAAGLPAFEVCCPVCSGLGSVPVYEEIELGDSFMRVPAGDMPCPEGCSQMEAVNVH